VLMSWVFKYELTADINATSAKFGEVLADSTKSGFSDYLGVATTGLRTFFVTEPDDNDLLRRNAEVNHFLFVQDSSMGSATGQGVIAIPRAEVRGVWLDLVALQEESLDLELWQSTFKPEDLSVLKHLLDTRWSRQLDTLSSEDSTAPWASDTLLGADRHMRVLGLRLSCGEAVADLCERMHMDELGVDSGNDEAPVLQRHEDDGFNGLPFIIMAICMFLAPICFGRKCMRFMNKVCNWMKTDSRPAGRQARRQQPLPQTSQRPLQATQVSKATVAKFQQQQRDVPGVFEISGSKEDSCVVCLAEFVEGIDCVLLPCGHVLHWRCWALWSARAQQCPMCRTVPKWEDISKVLFTVKDADEDKTTRDTGQTMETLAAELEAVRTQLGVKKAIEGAGDAAARPTSNAAIEDSGAERTTRSSLRRSRSNELEGGARTSLRSRSGGDLEGLQTSRSESQSRSVEPGATRPKATVPVLTRAATAPLGGAPLHGSERTVEEPSPLSAGNSRGEIVRTSSGRRGFAGRAKKKNGAAAAAAATAEQQGSGAPSSQPLPQQPVIARSGSRRRRRSKGPSAQQQQQQQQQDGQPQLPPQQQQTQLETLAAAIAEAAPRENAEKTKPSANASAQSTSAADFAGTGATASTTSAAATTAGASGARASSGSSARPELGNARGSARGRGRRGRNRDEAPPRDVEPGFEKFEV